MRCFPVIAPPTPTYALHLYQYSASGRHNIVMCPIRVRLTIERNGRKSKGLAVHPRCSCASKTSRSPPAVDCSFDMRRCRLDRRVNNTLSTASTNYARPAFRCGSLPTAATVLITRTASRSRQRGYQPPGELSTGEMFFSAAPDQCSV